ncbi:hypothetical protein OE88DRAFT_1658023 [Heliocybe sulcata]|uniref:YEATS domain-containing protein n=1 Tax=Heliocybe sulcata TaxID=5364 RepID=A0A5C3N9K1_9AGAM|nr:hypothetical protein OE88DRAFT_1658023 [Heliocybe sulcata]
MSEDGDRPRKRRKTSGASESWTTSSDSYTVSPLQQIIAEEIDLEIALRQRLASTISDRITWALLLQESLDRQSLTTDGTTPDFRASAVDALQVTEAPCDILFSREPFRISPSQTIDRRTPPPLAAEPQTDSRRRAFRKPHVSHTQGKPKCLFIRHNTSTGPVLAKLECPDCGRSEFPNLQGCFNHCLLKHKKQYGSHDECIQRCAVVIPEEQKDWVIANGLEIVGGHLPSLRRLFEIAVGGAGDIVTKQPDESARPASQLPQTTEQSEAVPSSGVHLTRTLGLHKDTPSLAPFLGKAPPKRCVNSYNEDEDVDILGDLESARPQRSTARAWHKPYQPRNTARPELDVALDVSNVIAVPLSEQATRPLRSVPSNSAGTRFHIMARVIVADRSLWIPPERRASAAPSHTHRWMISVDSPSYSLHISTFLHKMTVSCITEPPPSTLVQPITITEPPFVVRSTTDKPFLVRVKLQWAGAENAPMEVEHWVELEQYKHQTPVLGDEQVLDVELDRGTELLPLRQIRTNTSLKDMDDTHEGESNETGSLTKDVSSPNYMVALTALLNRFPMTLKDVKGRARPQVPYRLVTGLQQLQALTLGRRKAIEWARAKALQEAYRDEFAHEQGHIPLTTRDVFCWLEDEGHFLRPPVVEERHTQDITEVSKQAVISQDVFCHACGFSTRSHGHLLVKSEPAGNGSACPLFSRREDRQPIFDVYRLLATLTDPAVKASDVPSEVPPVLGPCSAQTPGHVEMPAGDLVAVADPSLTVSIMQLLLSSGVRVGRGVERSLGPTIFALEQMGARKEEVEETLAGPALLAVLVKLLIRLLLDNAVRSLKPLHETVQGHRRGSDMRSMARRVRCLTPRDIVQGLGAGEPHGAASSLLLSGLGVAFLDTDANSDLSKKVKREVVQDIRL